MSLIRYVTRIHFADNVLEDALEAETVGLGARRPLIIADGGPERAGVLARLLAAMPRTASGTLFQATSASEAECRDAAVLYRDCAADSLIGFGGPAAISLTKAVAVRVSHAGPLRRFAGEEGGHARIRDELPPMIAVPTLSGSCAEVLGIAVLSMQDGSYIALVSPYLTPRAVICDPTLTLDLPAGTTASTGMDALTHCLETFIASAYNPPADGIARDGLRRAAACLEGSVADGSNLHARREMMAAALNGALASQKGLGAVHAMSRGLAGACRRRLDHGALNAVLLPHALAFNAPAVAHRYDAVREDLGLPPRADLPEAIVRLRERIALPARLADVGVAALEIGRAAALAEGDHSNRTNPRRADSGDYLTMLRAAL